MKITAFIMSLVMALLSVFGINFNYDESREINMYSSAREALGENENTAEIGRLLSKVKGRTPELRESAERKPFPDDNRIKAVYFDGENYNGKAAEIFAYIGFPEGASTENPVPAMVLVHGGAGHAYAEWVKYWVDNGYAAISVDGFGQQPEPGAYPGDGHNENWSVNPNSHPTIDELRSSDKPLEEQWFYFYVTDVILGNNILRADKCVITDKIGVTGISWGSVAVSAAICYDERFAFAVPVYGSGFLNESTGMIGEYCNEPGYVEAWEPSHLLDKVKMPVLYVNGDSDPFFSPNCTTASLSITENAALSFIPEYPHGQNEGSHAPEILRFAEEQNGRGNGNIKIEKISFNGKRAVATLNIPDDINNVKIKVYYKKSCFDYDGFYLKEKWKSRSGIVIGSGANVKIPENCEYFYISVCGKANGEKVYTTSGVYSVSELKAGGAYKKLLNTEKLSSRIEKTVNADIAGGRLTGAEILVNQSGERVFDRVFGLKEVGGPTLQKNAMYRIASMTKPITAIALLIEYDRGNLDIYNDVSDYLDGYENMTVAKLEDGQIIPTVQAKNSVKVYQLVSHTSGIGSGTVGEALFAKIPKDKQTIAGVAEYFSTLPLSFDPGTAQEYSTAAFDVAARIVEITSGMDFYDYIKLNIFDKLGMTDTVFEPNDGQWSRFVGIHTMDDSGNAQNFPQKEGCVFASYPCTFHLTGGGLASTAEDYMKFAEMLLNFGKAPDGTEILSSEMVELMRTPVVDDSIMPGNQKWGLGVRVITGDNTLPEGSFGWSGYYGTHFWIDPLNGISAVYMKNSVYDGGAGCKTSVSFENDVMKSLS